MIFFGGMRRNVSIIQEREASVVSAKGVSSTQRRNVTPSGERRSAAVSSGQESTSSGGA